MSAGTTRSFTPDLEGPYGRSVILNGIRILTFRVSAGGLTPDQRWDDFQRRLQRSLLPPHRASQAQLHDVNGEPTIFLRGQQLVTVTAADAAANGTTRTRLAHIWLGHLRRALAGMDRD
jgi:hypothetical protein